MVRRIHEAGHTIGTHSQTHPLIFDRMPLARVEQEIDQGIASVGAALGDPDALAPFFRIPGLARADGVERSLAARSLMTWSADFPADDWRHIKANEIVRRALMRLEAKGKGILLLHDIQPATIIALPTLLKELKARGYRIVHIVSAGPERSKTATEPQQWTLRGHIKVASAGEQGWPRVPETTSPAQAELLAAPDAESFATARKFAADPMGRGAGKSGAVALAATAWPRVAAVVIPDQDATLPVPSEQTLSSLPAPAVDTAFPALPARSRIAASARKDLTSSDGARRRTAAAHAVRTPPRTILDLLMPRRHEARPQHPKARVISRLAPPVSSPEPELR